ncbi:patatin family protein [Kurthia sibirica]|uniref:Patatin family protein n=2 Tax=Kurthia sibirica TaxID=202750 RepID=A0A2U3APQ4_9BACL|nr:patatin family protein [Kurthia sibirica]
MNKTSLIMEGGTFRALFSAGVLDAFIDEKIKMPYVLGISAGAITAVSYISGQKERTLRVFANYRNDKRYLGMRNFIKEKSIFGLDFAYNIVPNELDLFDWETYYNYDGILKFGVTNAQTGEVEYMNGFDMDKECLMLRATCAIPVLFPEIKINNIPYYDGGLAEPVPVQQAIDEGYEKHVIVLTRPKGYRKTVDRQSRFAMRMMRKKYPKLVAAMEKRAEHYNRSMELVEKLEAEGRAFVYRPDSALKSFEKNEEQMHRNYQMGFKQATARVLALKGFLQID